MIFAKLDWELERVVAFPLTEGTIRAELTNVSLPSELTSANLPRGYTVVYDKNNKILPESLISKIEKLSVYKNISQNWTILETVEELSAVIDSAVATLEEVRLSRIKELVVYTDTFTNTITEAYKTPNAEMQTWNMQFQEALAWSLNSTSPTPTLDMIAFSREVDVLELKTKALFKALQYQKVISFIIGKKQYFEDLVNSSTSITDLEMIKFEILVSDIQKIVLGELTPSKQPDPYSPPVIDEPPVE